MTEESSNPKADDTEAGEESMDEKELRERVFALSDLFGSIIDGKPVELVIMAANIIMVNGLLQLAASDAAAGVHAFKAIRSSLNEAQAMTVLTGTHLSH